jgi:multiple sugar transport system ATP-binding protein
MVFQNYGLYPHMTVAQNIGYPLKLRGIDGAERAARVKAAADRVELGALLERKPRQLSGGQRQRVALARVLVRTPTVFLMDEPLSNLDAKLRVSTRAEIKHLQHEMGVTTVYVTHDQIEAMTLAHRVAVMEKGVIRQLAPPEVLYDRPADMFVAGFVGSPAMSLVAGEAERGRFRRVGMDMDTGRADVGGHVTLGVRPEDVTAGAPEGADVVGLVYSVELTGESVLVTATVGDARLTAKADRAWRAPIGSPVGLRLSRPRIHLFGADGRRIPSPEETTP